MDKVAGTDRGTTTKFDSLARRVVALLALLAWSLASPAKDIPLELGKDLLSQYAQAAPQRLWSASLGHVLVVEVERVDENILLLKTVGNDNGLSNPSYRALNTKTGASLWEYRLSDVNAYAVSIDASTVIFSNDKALVAIEAGSGRQRWRRDVSGNVSVQPFVGGVVLAEGDGNARTFEALAETNGTSLWRSTARAERSLSVAGSVFLIGSEIVRIDGDNGAEIWRAEGGIDAEAADAALIDGQDLLVVDGSKSVVSYGVERGARQWASEPFAGFKITSLTLLEHTLFVRGEDDGLAVIVALNRANGSRLWEHEYEEESVSNMAAVGNRLFYATTRSLVCVDGRTGELQWDERLTSEERSYPNLVKAYDDHVVFIGETVFAGFSLDGARRFRYGVTPLSQSLSLIGLDRSIPRLTAQVRAPNSNAVHQSMSLPRTSSFVSDYNAQMAGYHQRRANAYSRDADLASKRGNYGAAGAYRQASIGEIQSSIAATRRQQEQERRQATVDMALAIANLGVSLSQAYFQHKRDQGLRQRLERDMVLRSLLYADFGAMEFGDFVYRPSVRGDVVMLKLVDMRAGTVRELNLSPAYLDYGITNWIDPDTGVLYHHGPGFDDSLHRATKLKTIDESGRMVEPLFIAYDVSPYLTE